MKKILSCFMALSMVLGLSAGMTFSVSADTLQDESDAEDTMTLNEFLAAAEGAADGEDTLDQLYASFKSGFNEDGSVDSSIYDYKEEQVETLDAETYPETFDLRHVDGEVTYNKETKKNDITGGTSYVTPVKFQNPWGTCWAFGITAASEASILYESGSGTTTADNDTIDLSEHHLAWFAKNHIPAADEEGYGTNYVNNQDGEGMVYTSGLINASMNGGTPFLGTSVFATGTGIVDEEVAPYCGKNKGVIVKRNADADQTKYPDATKTYDTWTDWENAPADIKANYTLRTYSDTDDWSLDESLRFIQSYALEESNVLPAAGGTVNAETGAVTLNEDGINAVKSELTQGRAVEVAFFADSSDPNQPASENTSRYINSNYAHYCWDQSQPNHSVCIVGWDDDYDTSNFGQTNPVKYDEYNRVVYKLISTGQEVSYDADGYVYYINDKGEKVFPEEDELEPAREEDGSVSVPAGNGAWIVKNSWGSADGEFPNKNTWGADGSGYFYLSYYDVSISMLETYDFIVTDEEKETYSSYSIIDQYDYMTASSATQSTSYAPTMMANIFTAEEDMQIEAVSCETTSPGTEVIYGICLMEDDEDYPTGNDKLYMNAESVTYTYGGYHRQALDTPLTVSKGQKYAVIVMEYMAVDSDAYPYEYYICSNSSYSKKLAEQYGVTSYNVGIINPGESYILTYGYNTNTLVATDYYNYISNMQIFKEDGFDNVYDNFSIKAYAEPVNIMYRLYNPNSGEHLYTSSTEEIEKLTALGWQNEGEAWAAPKKSSTPVYRVYNPNSGDHHYTTNSEEVGMLVDLGWVDEGTAWYSADETGVPVYRLFNPNATSATHHYTGFDNEKEWLIGLGWQDEDIAWYAISIPENTND